MKQYTLIPTHHQTHADIPSKTFQLDSIDAIAKHFGTTNGAVHHYLEKNNPALTFSGHRIVNNGETIQANRTQEREDTIRQEAYEKARAELKAELEAQEAPQVEEPKKKSTYKRKTTPPTE